jgi:hypothetical protein
MIVIIKSDGTQAGPMAQAQAESYLFNVHSDASLTANMKQALNDLTGGKGKASQPYVFNGHPILHASSGNGVKSISLFFYRTGGNEHIIAMGEHTGKVKGKETYKLTHYGQNANPTYKKGAVITLG